MPDISSRDVKAGHIQSGSEVEHLILEDGSLLSDLVLVRRVPGKRDVYRAKWQNQHVYAKVFIGKNHAYYASRDLNGVQSLADAGIETPPLLTQSKLRDVQAQALVFQAIAQAQNAEEAWRSSDDAARFDVARRLVTALARHHQAGLIQTDLYLKNFLVREDKIYTLDGDGIRRLPRLFRKHHRLANLATLFSKMDVLDDQRIPQLYQHYCRLLGVVYDMPDQLTVQRQTQKIRSRMASAYADKKVFRNCTDVKVSTGFRYFLAAARHFEWMTERAEPLDALLGNAAANLKNGNTCTVGKAMIADRVVVIKRYNIKNFWHGLNRALRPSRAAVSWGNAHRLMISEVATPAPLALYEERFGWLHRRAYFLSEYVEAPDAQQFFAGSVSAEDKKMAAANIARLLYRLYLFRFSHGDFKANNIKLVNLEPVLIDLDAMQAHRCIGSFERRHIRDLQRFMQNWAYDAETAALLKQALRAQYAAQGDAQSVRAAENILIRAGIA